MSDPNCHTELEFEVKSGRLGFVEGVVQCHRKAFPAYFSTLIGPRFLKSLTKYYTTHPDAIMFVATLPSGKIIGVVSGGKPELRSKFSHKYLPFLALDILTAALKDRTVRVRLGQHLIDTIKKTLARFRIVGNDRLAEPRRDCAGTWCSLLSICTDPEFSGKGVGTALMHAFEQESRKRGYRTMHLSVHHGNDAAIRLYSKCGWIIILENARGVYFKKIIG